MAAIKVDPMVDTKFMCEYLGVSRDLLEELRKNDDLPYYRIRNKIRYDLKEVEVWKRERKVNGK